MTKILEEIASAHLDVETLQTRNSDDADFHELAVWNIKEALEAAYAAGAASKGEELMALNAWEQLAIEKALEAYLPHLEKISGEALLAKIRKAGA